MVGLYVYASEVCERRIRGGAVLSLRRYSGASRKVLSSQGTKCNCVSITPQWLSLLEMKQRYSSRWRYRWQYPSQWQVVNTIKAFIMSIISLKPSRQNFRGKIRKKKACEQCRYTTYFSEKYWNKFLELASDWLKEKWLKRSLGQK